MNSFAYLEAVLSRRIGHGAPLPGWIDVRVRSTSITFDIALLFKFNAVFLRIGRTKCAIAREISRIAQNRRLLRRLITRLLTRSANDGSQQNNLQIIKCKLELKNIFCIYIYIIVMCVRIQFYHFFWSLLRCFVFCQECFCTNEAIWAALHRNLSF